LQAAFLCTVIVISPCLSYQYALHEELGSETCKRCVFMGSQRMGVN